MSGNYSADSAATPRVSVLSEGHQFGTDEVPAGQFALLLGDPENAAFALVGTLDEIQAYIDQMLMHMPRREAR